MDPVNPILTVTVLDMLLTFIAAIAASSGFWMFIMKKTEIKSAANKLLLGLAHDRIMYLGLKYIERGFITKDEYENLYEYLYKPYKEMNGNGSGNRVMIEVDKLPICADTLPICKEKFKKGESNVTAE